MLGDGKARGAKVQCVLVRFGAWRSTFTFGSTFKEEQCQATTFIINDIVYVQTYFEKLSYDVVCK